MSSDKKLAFVIAPIGDAGTPVRERSDQVLEFIIKPACNTSGYEVIRADKISDPGIITSQIIQHLIDAPLVIADLTGRNPNVFYELAIRHGLRKPVIQIIEHDEQLPFDVASMRTIKVNYHDLKSANACTEEISKQIRAMEENPADFQTPLGVVSDLHFLAQSQDPVKNANLEIIAELQLLRKSVTELIQQEPVILGRGLKEISRTIQSLSFREGDLLSIALPKITSQLRDFVSQYSNISIKQRQFEVSWIHNQKFTVLKNICEILKQDRREYESAGDYFKATLFRVKTSNLFELDCSFYPPGIVPRTKKIDREKKPNATAFKCYDSKAMEVIPNVREEIKKSPRHGQTAGWVELYPGQAQKYGSMVSAPIKIGDAIDRNVRIASILTIDTNRVNYFSENQKDRTFLANLLAPFRQHLSLLYLMEPLAVNSNMTNASRK